VKLVDAAHDARVLRGGLEAQSRKLCGPRSRLSVAAAIAIRLTVARDTGQLTVYEHSNRAAFVALFSARGARSLRSGDLPVLATRVLHDIGMMHADGRSTVTNNRSIRRGAEV